jgi:uncharacterized cupin superfamily protein
VVEGELSLELDGAPHRVGPGDAIVFAADRPHTYRNAGGTALRCAMVVVVEQEPSTPSRTVSFTAAPNRQGEGMPGSGESG